MSSSPFFDIGRSDDLRIDLPWTLQFASRQPTKIKLTTDFRVGPTGVRNVVGVEGHHVTEDIRVALNIWNSVVFGEGERKRGKERERVSEREGGIKGRAGEGEKEGERKGERG